MPRQDVPYPGAMICSLKERIAELEDEIDELMKSINGVKGDGNGNVQLLSGNAALTVTNDQVNNKITLDLDPSQLPAADVNSVNGKTGTVILDDTDIPSSYRGDVNAELAYLDGQVSMVLPTAIYNESGARANADAALQGNINAALATIPGAAASAVQNDATVIQLSSDVTALQAADANNVKLSGSQTITGIKEVPLQTTGSYNSQIASSQKVKNELDAYAPMVRTSGNQTIAGNKDLLDLSQYRYIKQTSSSEGGWRLIYVFTTTINCMISVRDSTGARRNGRDGIISISIANPAQIGDGTNWNTATWIAGGGTKNCMIAYDANNNRWGFFYNLPNSSTTTIEMIVSPRDNTNIAPITIDGSMTDPTAWTSYATVTGAN